VRYEKRRKKTCEGKILLCANRGIKIGNMKNQLEQKSAYSYKEVGNLNC
jgi:hypothetical protein